MDKERSYFKVYLAWVIVVAFFCYQYTLRISPSLMRVELTRTFGLTAEDFSTLSSYYLYLYALVQIPLGILVDKVGVRRVVTGSVLLCLGSMFLFANATELWMVQLSRGLLGAGSACGFMCGLKMGADYLPRGKRGLLMGSTLAVGTMGAFLGSRPLLYLLENFEWQEAIYWAMLPGVGLILLLLFVFPKGMRTEFAEGEKKEESVSISLLWDNFIGVLKNYKIMMYALLAIGVYTPLAIVADLWGVDYLQKKYVYDRSFAALMNSIPYVGLMVGSFLVPWFADKYGRWNQTIRISSVMVLGLFSSVLYVSGLSVVSLGFLLLMIGFFCGAEVTCFTAASRYVGSGNTGLVLGFVNTFNMLGGAILQYFVGKRLDFVWGGTVDNFGSKVYTASEYTTALSLLTMVLVGCVVISLCLRKEKRKKAAN